METFQLQIAKQTEDGSSSEEFEATFNVGNITSDIFIFIKEGYSVSSSSNIVGRIVVPISRYIGSSGPIPPKLEWMQLYPTSNTNVRAHFYIMVLSNILSNNACCVRFVFYVLTL